MKNVLLVTGALYATLGLNAAEIPPSDWPAFNRDPAATRFSPLTQINTRNVTRLTRAWSLPLNVSGVEVTPLVVGGVMYLPADKRVLALDAATGKEIWRYDLPNGAPSRRGVAYWPGDSNNPPRIIFTADRRMIGLNARTGKLDPGFGREGEVDTVVPYNSPPTIYKNLIFIGANVGELQVAGQPGNTRAFDARTGAKVWEFHSVPQPGEAGNESWEGESWKDRTGVNNWGYQLTIDAERSIVYTNFGSPASDYYGADRKGNNLFGNSVVALDAETGKMKWYFQAVHHDIWDFDLPPSPALLDVTVRGKKIPIIAQTGKVGYMYILNRITGEPVFGIKETPVPQSKVPGEQTSATQPIPVKPPAFGRMSFGMEDLVTAADTTAEHAAACRELVAKSGGVFNEGPFTPWVYRAPGAPPASSVIFPGAIGGANWGGMAADPRLGYYFVYTNEYASLGWIEQQKAGSRVPYQQASVLGGPFTSKFRWTRRDEKGRVMEEASWPCQKPPWGRLTAVNAATGDFAWQIPLGVTDQLPEGKRHTGRIGAGGPIATAGGLLFIGATNDRRFRAINSKTGKELWETRLPGSVTAVPISYLGTNGKQYVAVTYANGHAGLSNPDDNPTDDALIVFTLPQ